MILTTSFSEILSHKSVISHIKTEYIQAVSERAELYKAEKHDDHLKMFAIIGSILGASEVLCNTSDIISFILDKDSADLQWLSVLLGSIGGSIILGFSIWIIWFSNKYKRK